MVRLQGFLVFTRLRACLKVGGAYKWLMALLILEKGAYVQLEGIVSRDVSLVTSSCYFPGTP